LTSTEENEPVYTSYEMNWTAFLWMYEKIIMNGLAAVIQWSKDNFAILRFLMLLYIAFWCDLACHLVYQLQILSSRCKLLHQ